MKKLFLVALAAGTFAFTSCSSDDDNGVNCTDLTADVSTTGQAYTQDQSDANCMAYAAAIEAYMNANCEGAADWQAQYDALPCTE